MNELDQQNVEVAARLCLAKPQMLEVKSQYRRGPSGQGVTFLPEERLTENPTPAQQRH